jgi:hypothetical protein
MRSREGPNLILQWKRTGHPGINMASVAAFEAVPTLLTLMKTIQPLNDSFQDYERKKQAGKELTLYVFIHDPGHEWQYFQVFLHKLPVPVQSQRLSQSGLLGFFKRLVMFRCTPLDRIRSSVILFGTLAAFMPSRACGIKAPGDLFPFHLKRDLLQQPDIVRRAIICRDYLIAATLLTVKNLLDKGFTFCHRDSPRRHPLMNKPYNGIGL